MTRTRRRTYALSRRQRAAAISVCLAGIAFFAWLDRNLIGPRWASSSASRRQAFAADFARYHGGGFLVVKVVDGDTLHLAVPDADGTTTKVRLLGIDAPELSGGARERMHFGPEAAACAERLAFGKRVTIYLDEQATSRDRYRRLLAYIELPDGRFMNEEFLLGGCAYADLRFRHSYYQKYQQLEASARTLNKGLWAQITPEQMPSWRQRMQQEAPSRP